MRELTLFVASMPGILLAQIHLPLVQDAILELVIWGDQRSTRSDSPAYTARSHGEFCTPHTDLRSVGLWGSCDDRRTACHPSAWAYVPRLEVVTPMVTQEACLHAYRRHSRLGPHLR